MMIYFQYVLSYLVLIPSAILSILPIRHYLKCSIKKTILYASIALLFFSLIGACAQKYTELSSNLILFPGMIVFFILLCKITTCSIQKAFASFLNATCLMSFSDTLTVFYAVKRYPNDMSSTYHLDIAILQFFIAVIILIMLGHLFYHYGDWVFTHLDNNSNWILFSILPMLILFLNIMTFPNYYATLLVGRILYAYVYVEMIGFASLLYLYIMFYRLTVTAIKQSELIQENRMVEIQRNQLEIQKSFIDETRRIRHDFRHFIGVLDVLAQQGNLPELEKHLKQYMNDINLVQTKTYCKNVTINALFQYYNTLAVKNGIETNWEIHIPDELMVSESDFCTMMGNLMENAIHGCCTLKPLNGIPHDGSSRYFNLSVQMMSGHLYIVSTNSFNGITKKIDNVYYSTSETGQGIGMVSIARVVSSVGGTFHASDKDQEFLVDIML